MAWPCRPRPNLLFHFSSFFVPGHLPRWPAIDDQPCPVRHAPGRGARTAHGRGGGRPSGPGKPASSTTGRPRRGRARVAAAGRARFRCRRRIAPPGAPPHHKHTHRRVSLSLAPGSAGRRPCHLRQATPGDERWAGAKAPLARLAAPRRAEHRGRRVPGAACVPCLPRCLLKKARPKRMRLPPCRRRRRCPNQTHALVPGGHRVGRRRRLRTGRGSLIGTTCCPVDSACPQCGIHAQTTCTAASSAIPTPGAPRWALPTRRAPLD